MPPACGRPIRKPNARAEAIASAIGPVGTASSLDPRLTLLWCATWRRPNMVRAGPRFQGRHSPVAGRHPRI